jgi:hypothetical protein
MNTKITIDGVDYIRVPSAPSDAPEGLRYAIVRSRDQGVMSGYVQSVDGRRVTLLLARQMWRWHSSFVLPDAATIGVVTGGCKFSCEMSEPTEMLEACGVLYCSRVAEQAIRAVSAQVHA